MAIARKPPIATPYRHLSLSFACKQIFSSVSVCFFRYRRSYIVRGRCCENSFETQNRRRFSVFFRKVMEFGRCRFARVSILAKNNRGYWMCSVFVCAKGSMSSQLFCYEKNWTFPFYITFCICDMWLEYDPTVKYWKNLFIIKNMFEFVERIDSH